MNLLLSLSKTQRIFVYVLTLFFLGFIGIMCLDYILNPPEIAHSGMNKDIGNIKGSLFTYIPLTIFEYLLFVFLISVLDKISILYRLLIFIICIPLVFFAHIMTMEAGGVESTHAIWCTFLLLFLLVLLIGIKRN